jgi:hypothetical protein
LDDRDALRTARIGTPFGYFVAFVPPHAEQVVAEARGASGAVLGRLRFDPIVRSMPAEVFIAIPR